MKDQLLKELKRRIYDKAFANPRCDYSSIIHASDIFEMCVRKYCIFSKKQLRRAKPGAGAGLALTFEIGKKIQHIVTECMPEIVGVWQCLVCNQIHTGPRPMECSCHSRVFRYMETELSYPVGKFTMTGSIDVLTAEYDGAVPVEVKSIKPEDFDKLEEPLLQHVYQVETYLYLISKLKNKDKILKYFKITDKKGYIIYVCKAHKQEPFKIFEIQPSVQFKKTMDNYIKDLKTFSKTGKIPARNCSTIHHPLARTCLVLDICFKEVK